MMLKLIWCLKLMKLNMKKALEEELKEKELKKEKTLQQRKDYIEANKRCS